MNRREFADICGGGILGAGFLKLAQRMASAESPTGNSDHSTEGPWSQLVVTAVVDEGQDRHQTYTWVIPDPKPGTSFAGPIMKYPGVLTGLSFYSTTGEYLGQVEINKRVVVPGDQLSITV